MPAALIRPRPSALWRVGPIMLAAALTAAACSTSTPPPVSEPTRTNGAASPATTGLGPSAPARLALAAYTAMWGDVQAVGRTSNYQDPRLAEHMQGRPLSTFRENLAEDQSMGIVGRGAPVLHPSVLSATATTATLADCLDDTHWLEVYVATGKPVDTVPGGHRYVTATVTNEGGTWKVTTLDVRGERTCT